MAGAGFKDFAVGEVLTASDVDTYLMQQTVMNFADSAARGSALGTATGTAVPLAEGMVSYLADTDKVEVYDGSTWVAVGLPLGTATPVDGSTLSYSTATATYDPTAGPAPIAYAAGTASVVTPGGPGVVNTTITFPSGRFSSPPNVYCSFNEGSDANTEWGEGALGSFSVTSTGFTMKRYHSSGDGANSYGAQWLAVEFR